MRSLAAALLVASTLFAAGCGGNHHGSGSVAGAHSYSHGSSGSSSFGSSGSHSSSRASSTGSSGSSSHGSSGAVANAIGAAAVEMIDLASRDDSGAGAPGDGSNRDRGGQAVPETECLLKLREWRQMHPDAEKIPPQLRCGPDGSWPARLGG